MGTSYSYSYSYSGSPGAPTFHHAPRVAEPAWGVHAGPMRVRPFLLVAVVLSAIGLEVSGAADYDVLIVHGRVVDGTGNPAVHADVGILDGRVVAVGRLQGEATTVLDAEGCVVAPGFIDVHTHAENIRRLPEGQSFLRMGVTTLVLGNCGSAFRDVAASFRELEETTVSPNVATLLGQGTIRGQVMGGSFLRPPTEAELAEMKSLVREGMKAGAVGLSTGLIYPPGTFSKTEELIELTREVAPYDGIYVSHMRDEGEGIFEALDELFRIAEEAGVRAEISHIKLSGRSNWGQAEKVLAHIESARARGLDITQDMYVYPASSTGISTLIPTEAREGGRFKERLADPEEKAKIVAEMKDRLRRRQRTDYDYAMIASYDKDPSLNGLSVLEATRLRKGTEDLDAQIELIFEIQLNGGAGGVFHGMSEEDLQTYLRHPNTMIGADSSVREYQEGVPHPRGYGNAARVLGRYVRELNLLRLEDAVRRMTSLPARTFRLEDRGDIRAGAWADVVVFDPETVQDRATFREPHQYATGFRWVLVNGVVVVEQDAHTGRRPGRVLRSAALPSRSE